ncbi:hypothetical protein CHS0354_011447 [Potamilus streckersoni]|uniref:Uncharacterized protein n=1 Tax=Potamilus streckersoni TaxID=2493646 RepID=A0AAE0SLB6_9BIVA|nr:hypothetical protein CHS0354_011447 [Potamilus streckersoni]
MTRITKKLIRTIGSQRFILFLIVILIVVTWILITRNSLIICNERYSCGIPNGMMHNIMLEIGAINTNNIERGFIGIKGIKTGYVDIKGLETESDKSKIADTEFVSRYAAGSIDTIGINSKLTVSTDFDNDKHNKSSSCCNLTFCLEYTPPTKAMSRLPGPIHICIPAGKVGVVGEVGPLVKSVVLHAKRADVFFHLLTRGRAVKEIQNFMDNIQNTSVKFMYELMPLNKTYIIQENSKINLTISHHSGVWGMSKAYMYKIFKHVKKCIVLDADTAFGTDPAFLWDYFSDHNSEELITMRISHSMTESWQCNAGVMLQDFEKMRNANFSKFYASAARQQCPLIPFNTRLRYKCGDQALYFGTFKANHSYFYRTLPNSWNLENCHEFSKFTFRRYIDRTGDFFGLLHLNCLLNSENKAFEVFVTEKKYQKLNSYFNYLIRTPVEKICSV